MFTGIIETLGEVTHLEKEGSNLHIRVASSIADELKIDQSVAHDGACLTVVGLSPGEHTVTAISETLRKTNLSSLKVGDRLNLERCTPLGGRLDGHIVQGHVDQTAQCIDVMSENGSWLYTFRYDGVSGNITIEKGAITVNGISLTVVNSLPDQFSVAIIPYTYENTNINQITPGSVVNLEFDVVGKYVARIMELKS